MIAHPDEALEGGEALALVAGPILYLLAQDLMRFRAQGDLSRTRSAGIAGCALVGVLGTQIDAVWTAALLLAVLVAVIGWAERMRT